MLPKVVVLHLLKPILKKVIEHVDLYLFLLMATVLDILLDDAVPSLQDE